jgi:hypothetical protein
MQYGVKERTLFSLSAITNRVQEILQPYIGKLFWVNLQNDQAAFPEIQDEIRLPAPAHPAGTSRGSVHPACSSLTICPETG